MSHTRRAVVAGLTAVPLATTAAVTAAAPDPAGSIQAAIARHREAIVQWWAAVRVECGLSLRDPAFAAASRATSDAWDRYEAAMRELVGFKLTTLAEALALLTYIEDFNNGGVSLGSAFRSDEDEWHGGEVEPSWPFAVMTNIARALERMT